MSCLFISIHDLTIFFLTFRLLEERNLSNLEFVRKLSKKLLSIKIKIRFYK